MAAETAQPDVAMDSGESVTLVVKTLANKKFSVTVPKSQSVEELKVLLQNEHEMGDAKLLKTIHHGKILKDKNTLGEIGVKNNDILVVMQSRRKKPKSKPKPSPAPTSDSSSTQPQASTTPATNNAPATTTTTNTTTSDTTATTTTTSPPSGDGDASGSTGNDMVVGGRFEETITNLTAMGFPRDQAEAALRAAYGNPARATEYLLNGLPQGVPAQPAPQQGNAPAQPSEQQGGQSQPAQPQGGGGQGLPQINPQMLQALVAQMAQSNPELAQNPQALQALLSNPQMMNQLRQVLGQMQGGQQGGGQQGGGGGGGQQPVRIQLSPEDRDAINTLTAMGFTAHQAYEAYTVSGKNLDAAASYLWENFGGS